MASGADRNTFSSFRRGAQTLCPADFGEPEQDLKDRKKCSIRLKLSNKRHNMKQLIFFPILLLSLSISGCGLVTFTASKIEASGNKDNLQKIELGMNRNQVKGIMGTPNKTEALSSTEGKNVLVWYYLTEGRGAFRNPDDWNYTPMVFENDILTGWGYTHLDWIRKQQN